MPRKKSSEKCSMHLPDKLFAARRTLLPQENPMRTHRFYTPIELKENASIDLPSEAAHHCVQVLRYKVGNELMLFNGDGFDYLATVEQIEKKCCQVKISYRIDPKNESSLNIHLFQGIARGDKMDLIIQKAVELGVREITLLFTQRCNVKLDGKRLEKKLHHWRKTIISACEQSGRAVIPKLHHPMALNQLVETKIVSIYLEPTASLIFKELSIDKSVSLFVGPEGGFSEEDLAHLKLVRCLGVKIGPRILRTETAGLSAVSILQSCFGDL